jgi:DNA repair exonuclease SbcCD nuclease subunit
MKYLIVSDIHWKEKLGYSDFIPDGRKKEKEEVLEKILSLSKGCDKIIFLGDQLNGRNNSSEVIKEFVQYLERFKQEIFILAGNHEKVGDGKSAIDFLKEIKNKKWHVITNEVFKIDDDVFCPYFYKGELGCDTHEEASAKLMSMLLSGKNLFMHHAVSGHNIKGIKTDDLNEIVLPRTKISKMYDKIFCGHIHHVYADMKSNIFYPGSILSNEVNEGPKFVYTMEDGELTDHLLPGREIVKLEDPTFRDMREIPKNSIVKVVLTKKPAEVFLQGMKEHLAEYDGSILVEDYKTERKIIKFSDGELDLNINNLMSVYSKEKNIDLAKLQAGYDLIK